jgi:hypothetical protein
VRADGFAQLEGNLNRVAFFFLFLFPLLFHIDFVAFYSVLCARSLFDLA